MSYGYERYTDNQWKKLLEFTDKYDLYDRTLGKNGKKILSLPDVFPLCDELKTQVIPEIISNSKSRPDTIWSYYYYKPFFLKLKEQNGEKHKPADKRTKIEDIADNMAVYLRQTYTSSKSLDKILTINYDSYNDVKNLEVKFGMWFATTQNLGYIRRRIKEVVDYINQHYAKYKLIIEMVCEDKKINETGRVIRIGDKIIVNYCEKIDNNTQNVIKELNNIEEKQLEQLVENNIEQKIKKKGGKVVAMESEIKKESYETQLKRFIEFLNKRDSKIYKKKISSFRKDMNFGNRFNEKYRLKYQVLKLVDDANKSTDLKVKVSEPIFDYENDTITIKFKATRKHKAIVDKDKKEKVENKVVKTKPKITEYKYVVDFEIKNIGWFKRVKHIEQVHKTYKATDLEQLDKQVMKDIDNLTLQLKQQYGGKKVVVILPYKINGRTPVEPFNK